MTSPNDSTASTRDHEYTTSTLPRPAQHHEYYWETVTFLVEDRLFKVPKYYFQKSDIFRTTFSLPPEGTAEGTNDSSPFKLEGINKDDFWSFLRVIYPKFHTEVQLSPYEWFAVLKLASMWNFARVQKHAIKKLFAANISPMDQIILGRTHKIQTWLIDGYGALVERDDPIDIDEGKILGVEATVVLFRARESVSSLRRSSNNFNLSTIRRIISEIANTEFVLQELKEIRDNVPEYVVALEEYQMRTPLADIDIDSDDDSEPDLVPLLHAQ